MSPVRGLRLVGNGEVVGGIARFRGGKGASAVGGEGFFARVEGFCCKGLSPVRGLRLEVLLKLLAELPCLVARD